MLRHQYKISMAATNTLVLYPVSGRGHIVSMLEFGKLILTHHPDFSITVIISTQPHNQNGDNLPAAYPSINFHYLPSPPEPNSTAPSADPPSLLSAGRLTNVSLHSALSSISEKTNLRAFIIDFFNTPAFEVADALHIPTYFYFTSGANALAMSLYFLTLSKIIPQSLKDVGGQVLNIPGMPRVLASDVPDGMNDRSSPSYPDCLEISATLAKSAGIIINTFESFESRVLAAIKDGSCIPDGSTPPIFTIGPVVETKDKADLVERHESLQWLDSQPSRSVVFLCFGSMGAFSRAQLKEIATGLEKSGVRFLWVVRGPPTEDKTGFAFSVDETLSLDSILPEGFLEKTRDRGLVVKSWAPQTDVLLHASVGGFVSHCGWNSILEAVSAGVPMVAWPLYAEQKVNRAFLVDEAKIAIRLAESDEGFVSAEEFESRVVELMSSVIGEELRTNVAAMRDAVVAAKAAGGTSRNNLAELAEIFKQNRTF